MKFEQFFLSNVFNNSFIGTLFRQAYFNGIAIFITQKLDATAKNRLHF